MRRCATLAAVLAPLLAACAGDAKLGAASAPARWTALLQIDDPNDIAGPRSDGRLVLAASGKLFLYRPGGAPVPFARGTAGYSSTTEEPYLVRVPGRRVPRAGCSWHRDDLYAVENGPTPSVRRIEPDGRASLFAPLPPGRFLGAIAYDTVGTFRHRLLVTGKVTGPKGSTVDVYAIDCRARVRRSARSVHEVEGGVAVAPSSFGRFGGWLIAPDEQTGRLMAISPRGESRLVAGSGRPSGGDIGIESVGFVPAHLGPRGRALLSDRNAPGNPHPGTNHILQLRHPALTRAGIRPGDLLVASEGGADTIAVRCRRSGCTVRHVANGPTATHGEGHIVFVR